MCNVTVLLLLKKHHIHWLLQQREFRIWRYAKGPQTDTRWRPAVNVSIISRLHCASATQTDGLKRSRHENDIRGVTTPWSTLSLSRNKFFEVAALSPLAAACDAMDAAMLTRKSTGGAATSWARGCKQCAAIGRAAVMGGA